MLDFLFGSAAFLCLTVGLFYWKKAHELTHIVYRQIAYDAIAYAQEHSFASKNSGGEYFKPEEQLQHAVIYFKMVYPLMPSFMAKRYCRSLSGKIASVGHSNSYKV